MLVMAAGVVRVTALASLARMILGWASGRARVWVELWYTAKAGVYVFACVCACGYACVHIS